VPVVPSCLLEPAWAGSAPCSMSAAVVSSRSFSQGIRWAATAAGCRAGWCLSTWWPRWCTAAGMSGSPARGARTAPSVGGWPNGRSWAWPRRPAAANGPGRRRWTGARAGVDGTSIWTPGHDQRQCSSSTALLCGCDPGRRGTTVQVEGHIEASTSDRRPSQGVTRFPWRLPNRPLPNDLCGFGAGRPKTCSGRARRVGLA